MKLESWLSNTAPIRLAVAAPFLPQKVGTQLGTAPVHPLIALCGSIFSEGAKAEK